MNQSIQNLEKILHDVKRLQTAAGELYEDVEQLVREYKIVKETNHGLVKGKLASSGCYRPGTSHVTESNCKGD